MPKKSIIFEIFSPTSILDLLCCIYVLQYHNGIFLILKIRFKRKNRKGK